GNVVESENNGFFNRANPFTPGQRLRGALSSTSDLDYFSFSATQGTDYLFECDSVPNPLYTFRVFCGQDTTTRLAFSGDLTAPAGGRGYIIWSAPTTGTYFLRMAYISGGATGGYRISTGIAGVGAERGRDSRDVFACYSDNGSSWSTPARVNDAAAYYDEYLPEVMVGADGMPYVSWFDWRDDGCGGKSYQYLSRSSDGGATWGDNQHFSDVQNDWTSISLNSNLAPDMGDYSHMYADARYLRPAWADGRGGSPDVYTARIDTWHQISVCQGDLAESTGSSVNPSWTVTNLNPLFANTYNYTLTSQRNWPLPAPGAVAVAADATGAINLSVAVPDSAASGVNRLCLTVTNAKGTRSQSCCFDLTVQSSQVGVPPPVTLAFDLVTNVPNPAADLTRIDFSLPQSGPVSLRIYGLRGERVRTLVDGDRPAGPNTVTWDGRDDHGRAVGAGAYFYRLEGFGQSRVRRLVWLR
ncbi:MAG: FlgD immunoglobulin-like domain containing protein, partial [Candidatus Eisenbacteria bacterium]